MITSLNSNNEYLAKILQYSGNLRHSLSQLRNFHHVFLIAVRNLGQQTPPGLIIPIVYNIFNKESNHTLIYIHPQTRILACIIFVKSKSVNWTLMDDSHRSWWALKVLDMLITTLHTNAYANNNTDLITHPCCIGE